MKFTGYFRRVRQRPDHSYIEFDRIQRVFDWIQRVIDDPASEVVQADGRIRRWGQISEMDGRYLRVVLMPDGETIQNAFFDRSFRP